MLTKSKFLLLFEHWVGNATNFVSDTLSDGKLRLVIVQCDCLDFILVNDQFLFITASSARMRHVRVKVLEFVLSCNYLMGKIPREMRCRVRETREGTSSGAVSSTMVTATV